MMSESPEIETPHELVLVNDFAATPQQVWEAWTDPEKFASWWVAPAWSTTNVVLEARPRGRFAAVQSADDGSMSMPFAGFYVEVEPTSKLSFSLSDHQDPDVPSRTLLTVLLSEHDGGTRQEFHQTGVITDEHYDGLRAGTMMFFDQLSRYLTGSND
jgi:uncharacterized protein YndB with AHSA1/START domain